MRFNVLGYGVMGRQIASLLYLLGKDVTIWNHTLVDEGEIRKNIKLLKRALLLNEEGKLNFNYKLADLSNGITIESIAEDINIKREVYSVFSERKDSFYLTNTSSISPTEIGKNVFGVHFFNPIHTVRLIEFYMPTMCNNLPKELANLLGELRVVGFEILEVNANRGYVANYILFNQIAVLFKLMEKLNYCEQHVDVFSKHLGKGSDVFSLIDIIGVDVVLNIMSNLHEIDDTFYIPEIIKNAVAAGVLGKKNKTSIRHFMKEKMPEGICNA